MAGNDTPSHELFGVPKNTTQYVFEGDDHCSRVLNRELVLLESDQSGEHSQFVIFSNVNDKTYDRYFAYSKNHPRGSEHLPRENLALVKMTTPEHASATAEFDNILMEKLVDMDRANRKLARTPSVGITSSIRMKAPDQAYAPKYLPEGRDKKWPTAVIETGYSQSRASLERAIRWWLIESSGGIRLAFLISIRPQIREILFQKWSLVDKPTRNEPEKRVPMAVYELTLSRSNRDQPIKASTELHMVIPFEDIFLQQPSQGEQDITFDLEDFESIAKTVWWYQFGDRITEP